MIKFVFYGSLATLITILIFSASIWVFADKGPSNKPGKSPELSRDEMRVPDNFKVELLAAEPLIHQPIAWQFDDKGRIWILENANYPVCPGEPKDRLVILEDPNQDGKYQKAKIFYDKLTFSSGFTLGFGGAWVGSPPNLLFLPDKDGDDQIDGPPQTVLNGWGWEDTHETLNNFKWGPDGWLYGTQGIYTNANVGHIDTPAEKRVPLDGAVWRYHPTKKVFERYCEGISNQWGLDWDDRGQAFCTACVIPHMWHLIPGGRYLRQKGNHYNLHSYTNLRNINTKSGPGAAFCGAMIYLGDLFPKEYRDNIYSFSIHDHVLIREELKALGSGYQSFKFPHLIDQNDDWARGLMPFYGPDGALYFNDWYDKIHCHVADAGAPDRTNGRFFRLTYNNKKTVSVDLQNENNAALVKLQLHENDWYVRHARRILQERGHNLETCKQLEAILSENKDETRRLRAIWALHVIGGFTETIALKCLLDESPHVRSWAIRLIVEDRNVAPAMLERFEALSTSDPSPIVRLELAAALQRLPLDSRWKIVENLVVQKDDAQDPNIPTMLWFGMEPLIATDPTRGLNLAEKSKLPGIQGYIAKRIASTDKPTITPESLTIEAPDETVVDLVSIGNLNFNKPNTAQEGWRHGRSNLMERLRTHPVSQNEPLIFTQKLKLPASKNVRLKLVIGNYKNCDYRLVININKEALIDKIIDDELILKEKGVFILALDRYAGQEVELTFEHHSVNRWNNEYAIWYQMTMRY